MAVVSNQITTISKGGTGKTTAQEAIDALLPDQTGNGGKVLKTNGTTSSWGLDTDTGITALTGDVTATGSGSTTATLASVGTAGTYTKVTTDSKGRVTSGTTLSPSDIPTLTSSKISDFATAALAASQSALDSKEPAQTKGSITTSTTGVTVGNGSSSTVGPNVTVNVQTASGSQPGLLSSSDWSTFNSKYSGLPSQSGNSGKFLTTDGSAESWADIPAAGITELTGDVTASGSGPVAATIANDAVTFAKIQNISTSRLLGRSTASSGDVEEISIGSGLSLSSGTLSNSAPAPFVLDLVSYSQYGGF